MTLSFWFSHLHLLSIEITGLLDPTLSLLAGPLLTDVEPQPQKQLFKASLIHYIVVRGWGSGSASKGAGHQGWDPETDPQDPHKWRRELISWKLSFDLHTRAMVSIGGYVYVHHMHVNK